MSLCSQVTTTLELLVHKATEGWQESQVHTDPLHLGWQQPHEDISLLYHMIFRASQTLVLWLPHQ